MRRAFRDRTIYLGDPDFVKMPLARLISADYAAGLRATIHPDKATPSDLLPGQPAPLEDDETTHFSIIDADGNLVSTTQTVNLLYGSGMVAPGTGVLLNNEMDDFALRAGHAERVRRDGLRRQRAGAGQAHAQFDDAELHRIGKDKLAVIGAPGGSRIITEVLLGILGYDAGLSAQQVAALPRYPPPVDARRDLGGEGRARRADGDGAGGDGPQGQCRREHLGQPADSVLGQAHKRAGGGQRSAQSGGQGHCRGALRPGVEAGAPLPISRS